MTTLIVFEQRLRRALASVCDRLTYPSTVFTVADPTAATFAMVPATAAAVGTSPNPGAVSMAGWTAFGTKRHLPGALARGLT